MIVSAEDLKDYCFRQLGSPVINIEVDHYQALERIGDAIQYFVERHYDGVDEVFYKHTVTRSNVLTKKITLPTGFVAVLDILESQRNVGEKAFTFEYQMMLEYNSAKSIQPGMSNYYMTMSHMSLINSLFKRGKQFTYNSVSREIVPMGHQLTDAASANLLKDSNDVETTNWIANNAVLSSNSVPAANVKNTAHSVAAAAAGAFSIEQDGDTGYYMGGTYTLSADLQANTYTGQVTLIVMDMSNNVIASKVVNLSQRWTNEHVIATFPATADRGYKIKIEGLTTSPNESFNVDNITFYLNNSIIVHGYKALDSNTVTDIYDDRWIKRYSTALIKKQWGQNIKKFDGIQLPGGLTMNGQTIYDEAVSEIEKLEEEYSLNYELPPNFMWA